MLLPQMFFSVSLAATLAVFFPASFAEDEHLHQECLQCPEVKRRLSGDQNASAPPSERSALFKGLVDLGFSLKDAEMMAAKPCEDRKVLWCNSDGLVSNLFAPHRGLTGTLSKELASLEALEYIGLENNQLKGFIPMELGQLIVLEQLDLSNNQLEGVIPSTLGQLKSLQHLLLSSNQLTGSIPKELGLLNELMILDFKDNQLTGEIPKELGNLPALTELDITGNQLTGNIPEELGQASTLEILKLSHNKLVGTIPTSFQELQSLKKLFLWSNQLVGEIPSGLGKLTQMEELNLASNQLSGSIPPELAQSSRLRRLHFDSNRLSGQIPLEFGNFSVLQHLSLGDNQLTGRIPETLGRLTKLRWLNLCQNHLEGEIPATLGKLRRKLRWLHLDVNSLSGSLPQNLDQLRGLQVLDLGHNSFEGSVTHVNWTRMKRLRIFSVGSKFLTGALPELPVQELEKLDLSHNGFSGNLQVLIEPFCNVSGSNLEEIELNHNHLTGRLPECLMQFSNLKRLSLNNNYFEGQIPPVLASQLAVLMLHHNRLSGELPRSLERLTRLAILTVHENSLGGSISALKLTVPCIHNNKLTFRGLGCGMLKLVRKTKNFSCATWEDSSSAYHLTRSERILIEENCPDLCNTCDRFVNHFSSSKASFHHNRFSCALPQSMQSVKHMENTTLYITVVMGNMLGNGRSLNVSWLSSDENFAFLYYSPRRRRDNVIIIHAILALIILAVILHACLWRRLRRSSRNLRCLPTSRVAASNFVLLRVAMATLFLSCPLFVIFHLGSGYYTCCPPLSKITAANLTPENHMVEGGIIATWCVMMLLFRLVHGSMPNAQMIQAIQGNMAPPMGLRVLQLRILSWFLWICIVTVLSSPSIFFAIAQALPTNNTAGLNETVLGNFHRLAPFMIVIIDQLLAHPLSTWYSALSGIEADRLLMTFRLFSAWLLSLLTTVVLHENCLGGWKLFWSVCKEGSSEHESFHWRLWSEDILNPKKDLCGFTDSWWLDGRCTRSIVDGLTPLLRKKLLIRTVVQPLVYLLLFYASRLDPEGLAESTGSMTTNGRHLRILGKLKVTGSLLPLRQTALLTTFMETLFFWSPLVPLLSLMILGATVSNLILFDMAIWSFRVQVQSDVMNRGAFLSRSYLSLSLVLSCAFQLWHAFGTKMYGRYVLLIVFLCLNGPWSWYILPFKMAKGYFWSDLHRVETERASIISGNSGNSIEMGFSEAKGQGDQGD